MARELPDTASSYFGAMVESYDSLITRAVPRYAELTAALIEYLPGDAERVVELGCGTGNLSLALAARFPEAELLIVDAAPEMVELTMARLAERGAASHARARPVVARFEDMQLDPRSVDIVASCISLHHVADKLALYRSIRRWLRPGGTFRFADQMAGGSPWNHDHIWKAWLAFCRRPGNLDEETIQELLDHSRAHDHYTSVPEHLRLLEQAGFVNADCVWREMMWGIVTGDAESASRR